MRYSSLVCVLLIALIIGSGPALPARAADCRFVLGFATLHSLIPETVGNCLEDEHFNPANGDSLQSTMRSDGTLGLLVWRKADNFTAFTDGFRTWVNGPFGLQTRLNSQRFFWEPNPEGLTIVPTPVPNDRCHTAGLSLSLEGTDAGAGNVVATFRLTNQTSVTCTFFGFVGAQMLDGAFNPLPTVVVRDGGFLANEPGPADIRVAPGGSAIFRMHWGQVEVGVETSCPTSSFLRVTPPDELTPLVIPMQIRACGGGRLDVSAVRLPG